MATNYVGPLAEACVKLNWTFLQPLTSSSYIGYGTSCLAGDAQEISELIRMIRKSENDAEIVMMGHSTGCQDIVTYCKRYHEMKLSSADGLNLRLNAAILQAPVSDRESMATNEDTKKWFQLAESMVKEGKKEELMPRDSYDVAPITAYRYHSLAGRGTDDDMFSSDLSDEELKRCLGCMDIPTLLLYSGSDEYVPETVNKEALVRRMAAAMATESVDAQVLSGADHAGSDPGSIEKIKEKVISFLSRNFN